LEYWSVGGKTKHVSRFFHYSITPLLRYSKVVVKRRLMKEPQSFNEFIAEQKRRLADNPECATSSYNLGVTLMQQGKLDEAIDAFREAIQNSARMFEAWVNLGYIFFKKGDLEQVVFANQKAVEVEPRYARGYANLGFAYLQLGRTEEAIDALEKALGITWLMPISRKGISTKPLKRI
jgi:tetratricopeptide (TPR) repeat protein